MSYDVAKLLAMSASQLDDVFKNGSPKPVPNGPAKGTAIIAPGSPYTPEVAEFVSIFVWKGKTFNKEKMVLVNEISALSLNAILAKITIGPSWIDGKECIILDYSQTSLVAHWVRDEIRLVAPNLYLGTVFWKKARLIHFALQFAAPGSAVAVG
ncbi:MAG: hypothetical protein M1840_003965 [Geoglossum simile]|nr:MAG: hypothetical protein M1840_003965 [Geoglossum simile]